MSPRISRLLPAAALVFAVGAAVAQQPAAAPVQIDWTKAVPAAKFKPPRLGNESSWRLKTPRIYGNSARKEQEWGVLDYLFETLLPWTDDMVVDFHVILDAERGISPANREKDAPRFSYLNLSLRYGDIAKGEHKVCAVILPAALQRFGGVAAIGCEVKVKGFVVYTDQQFANGYQNMTQLIQQAQQRSPRAQIKWWEFNPIMDKVTKRDGYLVDRAKTPFSLVAIDEYEVSK